MISLLLHAIACSTPSQPPVPVAPDSRSLTVPTVPATPEPQPLAEAYPTSPKLLERFDSWLKPMAPFQVIGNVHYVGSKGLGSYLITHPSGHVLIDGGLPENAPMIAASIEALGFSVTDVAWLLNSHAHLDHSGGLAELKARSGARLVASGGDRQALEGGAHLGAEEDPMFAMPPVQVDQIVADEQTLTLGGIALTAHITAGHTRGCTSWWTTVQEAGVPYRVMFFCSATVAGNRLVAPLQYEGIVEDYLATFERTRNWKPDVFLANHPEFFGMSDRRARQEAGDPLAFVDPDAFGPVIARLERRFTEQLSAQQKR